MFSVRHFCLDTLHALPIFSVVLGKKLHRRKDSSFQGLGCSLLRRIPFSLKVNGLYSVIYYYIINLKLRKCGFLRSWDRQFVKI